MTMQVRIYNPDGGRLDQSRVEVETFNIDDIVAAMAARNWEFKPGTYVALTPNNGRVLLFRVVDTPRALRVL